MNLLYSNCVPSLTYAAEVKDLTSSEMQECNVALNDSIRRIFSYNRWESTRTLRQELGFSNISEIFHSRRDAFISKCLKHGNRIFFFFLGNSTISLTICQDIKRLSLDIAGREISNLFFTISSKFDFEIKRNKIKITSFKF